MSLSITITGAAKDRLQAFADELQGDGSRHAAGRGVRRLLMDHLGGLDQSRPNKLGGKRTHFYADAARNTSYEITNEGALVHIHQQGIALHYYGGVIKPTGGRKFLTIPVDPSAYGRRASEFDDLEIAWGRTKSGKPRPIGLVQKAGYKYKTSKNKKTGVKEVVSTSFESGKWMYALVKSASIPEDKSILPDDESLQICITTSITDYLISRMRGHE